MIAGPAQVCQMANLRGAFFVPTIYDPLAKAYKVWYTVYSDHSTLTQTQEMMMRYLLVAFAFFCGFSFSAQAASLKLEIDYEALASCEFKGEHPCIMAKSEPVLLLFSPSDEIKLIHTSADSEVPGVAILVTGYRLDTIRLTDKTPLEQQAPDFTCSTKGTCFQSYGAKRTTILLPPGTGFKVVQIILGDRVPGVFLIPKGNQNLVKE